MPVKFKDDIQKKGAIQTQVRRTKADRGSMPMATQNVKTKKIHHS